MTISHLPQANPQHLDVQLVSDSDLLAHRIADILKSIATPVSKTPTLGFVQSPRPTWVYANRTHGDRWYWRTTNDEYELCPTAALSGRLVQLEFKEVIRRQQPVWKLWTTLEADRTYIIEAGKESVFSRSLLAAIATLQPNDLNNIVTLEGVPGDQNQESLFCHLYLDGTRVYGKWDDDPNWEDIAHTAMMVVNQESYLQSQSASTLTSADSPRPELTVAPIS